MTDTLGIEWEADDFAEFLENYGVDVLWTPVVVCPRSTEFTGEHPRNCTLCGGTRQYALPSRQLRVLARGVETVKAYREMGVYQHGDLICTSLPDTDGLRIGPDDRIQLLGRITSYQEQSNYDPTTLTCKLTRVPVAGIGFVADQNGLVLAANYSFTEDGALTFSGGADVIGPVSVKYDFHPTYTAQPGELMRRQEIEDGASRVDSPQRIVLRLLEYEGFRG